METSDWINFGHLALNTFLLDAYLNWTATLNGYHIVFTSIIMFTVNDTEGPFNEKIEGALNLVSLIDGWCIF